MAFPLHGTKHYLNQCRLCISCRNCSVRNVEVRKIMFQIVTCKAFRNCMQGLQIQNQLQCVSLLYNLIWKVYWNMWIVMMLTLMYVTGGNVVVETWELSWCQLWSAQMIAEVMPLLTTKLASLQLLVFRDHFVYAPSQWETALQCNIVSHWLGAYSKWSLGIEYSTSVPLWMLSVPLVPVGPHTT